MKSMQHRQVDAEVSLPGCTDANADQKYGRQGARTQHLTNCLSQTQNKGSSKLSMDTEDNERRRSLCQCAVSNYFTIPCPGL